MLFTFILDFRDGTYISQFEGSTPEAALLKWIEEVDIIEIDGIEEEHRDHFKSELEEWGFVAINDVVNVWCHMFHVGGRITQRNRALLNFVLTQNRD